MLSRAASSSVSSSLRNTRGFSQLKELIGTLVPKKREQVNAIKKEHGDKVLGNCTVEQAYGGMRDIPSLVCETSLLDAQEGIRFRGYSIPECRAILPKIAGGAEPQPEGLLWLLLTGEVPTESQVRGLTADLHQRSSSIPQHTIDLIRSQPKNTHPMASLCMGVMSMQVNSKFAAAYDTGMKKTEYWGPTYEDSLDLIARLPRVASEIYCHKYGLPAPTPNTDEDWTGNFAQMLGFNDKAFQDCFRLYLTLHTDHEGGNVSAHTCHLVGSALSDPYHSFNASMSGLAGPLHGLANQECFRWLNSVKKDLEDSKTELTPENMRDYIWATLKSGKVVPGYGHAVLRKTDPRFVAQYEFAKKNLPNDPHFKLMEMGYQVIPGVLTEHGKTKNPWPNVDCGSGVLLNFYGLKQQEFYTVLFGVSRALGVLSSLTWDRALGLPLERPKSYTSDWLENWGKTH